MKLEEIKSSLKVKKKTVIVSIAGLLVVSGIAIGLFVHNIVTRNAKINAYISNVEVMPELNTTIPHKVMNKSDAEFYSLNAEERLNKFDYFLKINDYEGACSVLSAEDGQSINKISSDTQTITKYTGVAGNVTANVAAAYYSEPLKVLPKKDRDALIATLAESVTDVANELAFSDEKIEKTNKAKSVRASLDAKVNEEARLKQSNENLYNNQMDGKKLTYDITCRKYDIETDEMCLEKYKKELTAISDYYFVKSERDNLNDLIKNKNAHIALLNSQINKLKAGFDEKYKNVDLKTVTPVVQNVSQGSVQSDTTISSAEQTVKESVKQAIQQKLPSKTEAHSDTEVPCGSSTFAIPTEGTSIDTPKEDRYYFKKDGTTYFRDKTK